MCALRLLEKRGRNHGLIIRVMDSPSKGLGFRTTGWLQRGLSLSSIQGQLNECQNVLGALR